MNVSRSTFSAKPAPPPRGAPIKIAHEMTIQMPVDGICEKGCIKSPTFKAYSDFEILFNVGGAETSVMVRSNGASGRFETDAELLINGSYVGSYKNNSIYGCVFYTRTDDVKKWISAGRTTIRIEITETQLLATPPVQHRILKPIPGGAPLKMGDEISYRATRGKDIQKMRVISAGVPWQEPQPGSGEITLEDIRDRDALTKEWGTGFDPVTMYTVLCDADWRPNTIVWILYFPNVAIQTALSVYAHRAFRQMCGAGRGSSIGRATRRNTVAGPEDVHFDYTEFPAVAYARPFFRSRVDLPAAASSGMNPPEAKKVKVETDA